jgi:hypothetical protein
MVKSSRSHAPRMVSARACSLWVLVSCFFMGAAQAETRIFPTFPADNDYFGTATSVSGDRALVGAHGDGPESVYVFERLSGEWTQVARLIASDGAVDDSFGDSVAISGDYAIVGARGDDDAGTDAGAAYVLEKVAGTWTEVAKLTASDGAAYAPFGSAGAIRGSYAVVGSPRDDGTGSTSGSAYFFERVAGSWAEVKKVTASDASAFDEFGRSVAISGIYAIIGSAFDDASGGDSGSAYLFQRFPSVWVQYAKLTAPDGAAGDYFGFAVALNGDHAVIGAPHDDDHGSDSGSVYVWERIAAVWTYMKKVTASDGTSGDEYGRSVAVGGEYAIVGAPFDYSGGPDGGSAYFIYRDGGSWTPWSKVVASDAYGDDRFGSSVAIGESDAFVGAPYDGQNGPLSGSVYVVERSGSVWSETDKKGPSDGAVGDEFGDAVAISGANAIVGASRDDAAHVNAGSVYAYRFIDGAWSQRSKLDSWWTGRTGAYFGRSVALDGDRAIVGAFGATGNTTGTGDAHLFERVGSWQDDERVYASDGANGDRFGWAVAIAGERAIVGAYGDDDGGSSSGSAYVFELISGSWTQVQKLVASDANAGDFFGESVAMDGDRAIIGAYGDNGGASDTGAAYVFERSGGTWSQVQKLASFDVVGSSGFGQEVAIHGDVVVVGAPDAPGGAPNSGAVYVFERIAGSWLQTARLTPALPNFNGDFGSAVAIRGDRILVGNSWDDDQALSAGAAHVFERIGASWTETAKLSTTSSGAYDKFGDAVALGDSEALVGARLHDDNGYNAGAVYAYALPEPNGTLLLCSGLGALCLLARRRERARRS